MPDDIAFSDFTTGEKVRLAGLVARMARRGAAGPGVDIRDLQARVQRIEKQARSRKQSK
jgi:uncharacterized protein DUF6257